MRYAVIKDGVVENVIRAREGYTIAGRQLIPAERVNIGQLWDGENFSDPPRDLRKLQADVIAATQARLDNFARERGYDGILSACSYAASTNSTFAEEGMRCVELRDETWAMLYQMLAEVQANSRPVPSSFAEIEPDLPDLIWPD
jgi:hypothetical protein